MKISEQRKADLYDGLLGYLSEMISDKDELVSVLKNIGFSNQEITFEGLDAIEDGEKGE